MSEKNTGISQIIKVPARNLFSTDMDVLNLKSDSNPSAVIQIIFKTRMQNRKNV